MTIWVLSDLLKIEDKAERRKAYFDFVRKMRILCDTLQNRISAGVAFTDQEIDALVKEVGKHCHAKTKERLARAFAAVPDIPSYGIFGRLEIHEDGTVQYFGGQDCMTELPFLRKCLIESRPLG